MSDLIWPERLAEYAYGSREALLDSYPGIQPERFEWPGGQTGWRVKLRERPAPATLHAKWYNLLRRGPR